MKIKGTFATVIRKVTVYRDDSVAQVVYDNVKTVFWTAGNTVLVIAQYTDDTLISHRYIHWLRENVCWFKVEISIAPIDAPDKVCVGCNTKARVDDAWCAMCGEKIPD